MFSILKKGLWFLPIKFLKKGTVNFVIKSINTLYIEKCCFICLRNKTALWLLFFFQFLPLTGKNWWISWKQEKWTNEKYSVHKCIVIHVLGSASRVSFFFIYYMLYVFKPVNFVIYGYFLFLLLRTLVHFGHISLV